MNRYRSRAGGAEVYWRRRAIALAVGMAVFGLIAWAVNGTLSGPPSAQTAAVTRASGQPGHGGTASGGTASAGTAATSAGTARPAASGRARGSAGQARGKTGARAGTSGRGRGPARGRLPAACPTGDVVLSLHQRRASYGAGARPSFTAEVISTASRPCAFGTGSRSVAVVIRSGRSPLWSSAYCASRTGARQTVLTRGIPAVLHFQWDRRTASPGCRRPRRAVRPGSYLATAVSGRLTSNSLIFVLKARGVAVP